MKIIVDTPEEYTKWLKEKTTVAQDIKVASASISVERNIKSIDTMKVDTLAKTEVLKTAMK